MWARAEYLALCSFGVLIAALLSGCAGPLYDWRVHTHSSTKVTAPILSQEGVAVLPAQVTAPHTGVRQSVTAAAERSLVKVFPGIRMLMSSDVLNLINTSGLVQRYGELVSGYSQHGLLDRARLAEIGSALETRYVLLPTFVSYDERMENRWVFLGIRVVQTRIGVIRLALQLWDTRAGRLIWSSTSEATLSSEMVRTLTVRLDYSAEIVWTAMLVDLLNNRLESSYTPMDHWFQQLEPWLTLDGR